MTMATQATNDNEFDHTVDVLVVGGGAAGFVAALAAKDAGLTPLLVEKMPVCGGSSLLSGGSIWIPNTAPLTRAGFVTSREVDLEYLESITEGRIARPRLEKFLDAGPEMISFLERTSKHMSFEWRPGYPDYHPLARGGSATGRSIEAINFDRRRLKNLDSELAVPNLRFPRGMWIRSNDLHTFLQLRQNFAGKMMFVRLVWRLVMSFITRAKIVTRGEALIGRLRLALRDADVPLWLNTALKDLITDDSGRVIGAVLRKADEIVRVGARNGVILCSGGFERNMDMRRQYHPIATEDWSMGGRGNTGDGIRAGIAVGGAVDLMDDAWWMPAIPWSSDRVGVLLSERQIPGQIIVNGAGKRFTNEAGPYTDFVHDVIAGEATGISHSPAWLILDDKSWRTYFFSGHLPVPRIPAPVPTGRKVPEEWLRSGAVLVADSLEDLSAQLSIPEQALRETIERFNDFARRGVDHDFGRGTSPYDRYYGDVRLQNPNLRELSLRGPYVVAKVVPGDLGTKGGLVTDEHARVLDEQGHVIAGLYATGNASASVMGNSYPGPGGTLGPAMTFGYVAAKHVADDARGEATGSIASQTSKRRPTSRVHR